MFVPGLLLLALNGCWIAILLAIIGTRYRDVPQLLGGLVSIMMFLTPIMWSRDTLSRGLAIGYVIDLNPLFHLVDVVRAPMLGQAPELLSWLVSIALVPIGFGLALSLFSRFRQRITYWL